MDDAFALLRLQVEWGADEALDLDPIDRLRPVEARPVPPPRPVPVAEAPKGTAGERALGLAGRAATLDELRAALADFDGCALRDTA
ncbi:MAG: uracil-DNA glycosylase, partial [Acetobacteraceae bacterium]|nr:uracil-DNA glycosylase [Acetobacteraceae bacterium]